MIFFEVHHESEVVATFAWLIQLSVASNAACNQEHARQITFVAY